MHVHNSQRRVWLSDSDMDVDGRKKCQFCDQFLALATYYCHESVCPKKHEGSQHVMGYEHEDSDSSMSVELGGSMDSSFCVNALT